MQTFPDGIRFCYDWRSYQAKMLENLDEHLANRHLHLVAPPGSGKTVLGLEVMLRLKGPTFILAPTLAIRNQWVERFVELFLQTAEQPDWISIDIRKPAFLTVTTYQGLHSIYCQNDEQDDENGEELDDQAENDVIQVECEKEQALTRLKDIGFQTFILDEAHHLRTAWWKSAIDFRDQLDHPAVVALTATPPYDVSLNEWQKYIQLCGPIDAEINVPDLVRESELCPHQDYVYTSVPSLEESKPITVFRDEVLSFESEIIHNQHFIKLLEKHPWLTSSEDYVEEMLSNHAYLSSLLIFLKASDSIAWQQVLPIIDVKEKNIPHLDLEWLEEMLTGVLFRDDHMNPKDTALKELHKHLSRIGAIERRKVSLRSTSTIKRTLTNSSSKLASIHQIVSFEEKILGKDLRLVILADYIRMPDLPKSPDDEKPLVRLGVIPIFEKIRRELGDSIKLGVLTGSIVILPTSSLPLLKACAEKQGLVFQTAPLVHDPKYSAIELTAASRQRMVSVMTEVFSLGGIQVLVGTTALLGEGWDAPSINALIIASYVGTFMLSNQMRGRAIRTERNNPLKTANIWHLVCVDPLADSGGHDLESLTRRFRSLTGLAAHDEKISTGIGRMNLSPPPYSVLSIDEQNEEMFQRAGRREELYNRWQDAVVREGEKKEELSVSREAVPRPFMFMNTLKAVLIMGIVFGLQVFNGVLSEPSSQYDNKFEILFRLFLALFASAIVVTPFFYKVLRIYFRNISIESSMVQVGDVVYNTLYHMGLIQTELADHQIHAERDRMGTVTCWLEGGSTHEQKLFLKALQEVVDPIENPRYLLFRKSSKRVFARYDYHALPEEIARRKEYGEFFLKEWNKRIGKAELIYTRTSEGRKILLTARMKAMSAKFVKKSDRISTWR